MVSRKINIRHWTIIFLFSFDARDAEYIENALVWAHAPNSIIERVRDNVYAGRQDEGFTFSDSSTRRSVVAIGETSSGPEFLNSTVHEIFHLAQDIAKTDKLDTYGESIAYLAGDITRCVSDIVCEMSCPRCRHKM